MSLITGMLGDTLALIGAELIGNDFLDTALESKKRAALDSGEAQKLKNKHKESQKELSKLGEEVTAMSLANLSHLLPEQQAKEYLDTLISDQSNLSPQMRDLIVEYIGMEPQDLQDAIKAKVKEFESVEGLTPSERRLISSVKALLFIISGAEFSIEKLISRISQDFSKNSLDTGEESIAERRISERLTQNQSASTAEEQSNSRVATSLQEKQALKEAQAVVQEGSSYAAPDQAHTLSEEGQADGLLFNSTAASIPQVIPVEVAVAEPESLATTLTATNPIQPDLANQFVRLTRQIARSNQLLRYRDSALRTGTLLMHSLSPQRL